MLHLSNIWQMPQVRHLAVGKMSCASSITKVLFGKRYGISAWIRSGFLDLCLRESPLTEDEGSRLDWKDILKISHAREMIRSKIMFADRHKGYELTKYGHSPVYKTSYDTAKYTQSERTVGMISWITVKCLFSLQIEWYIIF